jgi:hypothetical protein
MAGYELIRTVEQQIADNRSHIGGFPILPSQINLPSCKICGFPMTFFFQVEFPRKHIWQGKNMSVFACTQSSRIECQLLNLRNNTNFDIPTEIPNGFLETYQTNFRTIVFETTDLSEMRTDYIPVLRYESLVLKRLSYAKSRKSKVGGLPAWFSFDQTPSGYEGHKVEFLMQIEARWQFAKLDIAPFQAKVDWLSGGYWENGLYDLFSGTALLFFGTSHSKVYLVNERA